MDSSSELVFRTHHSHIIFLILFQCIVKSYLQWLQDSDYNPVCSLCNGPLSSDECGECIRLSCYGLCALFSHFINLTSSASSSTIILAKLFSEDTVKILLFLSPAASLKGKVSFLLKLLSQQEERYF